MVLVTVDTVKIVPVSVTTINNNPSQDYTHQDHQTTRSRVTPGFKPFTVIFGL